MNGEEVAFDTVCLRKRTRIDDVVSDAIPNAPTKITDVNIDCLEKVFKYLNVKDLFNLAESNTWLRKAVQRVYKSKKTNKVRMIRDYGSTLETIGEYIFVKRLNVQFRFLRYFGHFITCLDISYFRVPPNCCLILDQYINEYCAETLVKLSISDVDENTFKYLTKPFTNIETILIRAKKMPSFAVKLFPNMHHLELNCHSESDCDLRKIEIFLQSNPQLKSLIIETYLNKGICQSISNLPALETFGMALANKYDTSVEIHLANVKKFKIFSLSCFNKRTPLNLITFDQLDEVDFSAELVKDWFINALDFFTKHPTIKKLIIRSVNKRQQKSMDKIARLKKSLPSLHEVYVDGHAVSIDDLCGIESDSDSDFYLHPDTDSDLDSD